MILGQFLIVICLAVLGLVNSIPFQVPIDNQQRIVNGEEADIKEAPFMALLIIKFDDVLRVNCGGSILDSRHILTAAHCIGLNYKVIVGSTTPALPHTQEILVEKQIQHPLFEGADYDFGILKLKEDIKFNDVIKPLPLTSSTDFVPAGELLWTYGWGVTQNYTDGNVTLRKVGLLSASQKDCETAFPAADGSPWKITDRMMCAGLYAEKGICSGDSGGPLIYNGVQVGITSWSRKTNCIKPGGVYARVGAVLDWIKKMISK